MERFEVASVKPFKGPLTMISSNTEPGGRFVAQQQSLRDLIMLAYLVREGPAWIGNDRFDVNAFSGPIPRSDQTAATRD